MVNLSRRAWSGGWGTVGVVKPGCVWEWEAKFRGEEGGFQCAGNFHR